MTRAIIALSVALTGCALLHTAARPTAYGAELAACEQSATSWSTYTPCCVDVAHRYGRDPSFCLPDGGQ